MIISDNDDYIAEGVTHEAGNPALADAMKKVLKIGKNAKDSAKILAKAKVNLKSEPEPKATINSAKLEIIAANGELLPKTEECTEDDVKPEKFLNRKRKAVSLGRLKPSPMDREKERPLIKIATKGVVQLFNAVREQQKVISRKLEEAGPSETKKEKALKSVDKNSFLSVLRGSTGPIRNARNEPHVEEVKTEDENEQEPSWSVLRDDFMTVAKLKDWDKPKSDEVTEVTPSQAAKKPRKLSK